MLNDYGEHHTLSDTLFEGIHGGALNIEIPVRTFSHLANCYVQSGCKLVAVLECYTTHVPFCHPNAHFKLDHMSSNAF